MPLYDRKCNICDELFEVQCKIVEKDNPHECPYCGSTDGDWMIGKPNFSRDVQGKLKRDGGFREVLSKIHERSPGSTLRDRNTF